MNNINKVSRAGIAAAFRMHASNVNRWVERGCPKNPDGRTYNLPEVIQWRLDELAFERVPVADETAQKWLTKFRKERAKISEIERKKLEAGLAPREEIESEWAARVRVVTSGLEAFKNRLPGILVGKSRREIQDIIEQEVKILREAYAREGRYCPKEVEVKKDEK